MLPCSPGKPKVARVISTISLQVSRLHFRFLLHSLKQQHRGCLWWWCLQRLGGHCLSLTWASGQERNFLDGPTADVIHILNKIAFVFQADKAEPPRKCLSVLSPYSEKKRIYSWIHALVHLVYQWHCSRAVLLREWSGNSKLLSFLQLTNRTEIYLNLAKLPEEVLHPKLSKDWNLREASQILRAALRAGGSCTRNPETVLGL